MFIVALILHGIRVSKMSKSKGLVNYTLSIIKKSCIEPWFSNEDSYMMVTQRWIKIDA